MHAAMPACQDFMGFRVLYRVLGFFFSISPMPSAIVSTLDGFVVGQEATKKVRPLCMRPCPFVRNSCGFRVWGYIQGCWGFFFILPTPSVIVRALDRFVFGQEATKKVRAAALPAAHAVRGPHTLDIHNSRDGLRDMTGFQEMDRLVVSLQ